MQTRVTDVKQVIKILKPESELEKKIMAKFNQLLPAKEEANNNTKKNAYS